MDKNGNFYILSKLIIPVRANNPAETWFEAAFNTSFTGSRKTVHMTTEWIGEGEPPFDFIEYTFGSHRDEQIFGLGLQYTHTNFKG